MVSKKRLVRGRGKTEARAGGVLAAVALSSTLASCATTPRYPLRAPLWRDTDLEPLNLACHADPKPPKENPAHRVCAPEMYDSSFAWDAADNLVFRPISKLFAIDPGGEAVNVNSVDEVPDSSWFVNRIGARPMSNDEIAVGYCGTNVLDPDAADGAWTIDQGKVNGANPGFRVNIKGLGKFLLKSDPPQQPERATGATSIATRFYYAAGWWAPCDSVVYFRPSILSLKSGLTVTDNSGVSRPFDKAALDKLLAGASHRGDLVRMVASRWLPGRTIGPFKYEGRRKDDPADVINHEDRRDLRGARLIAAWLGHFDSREQNTMSTWMAENEKDPDSSPGYVRHWIIDIGDVFGSEWDWDGISKRLNYAYYFDFGYVTEDFLTLGIQTRPWDRAERSPDGKIFGFFRSNDFDPEMWRGGYPNPSFNRMTERDAAWAARIIARFTPENVESVVRVGDYTDPRHTPFLVNHLLARQHRILERYFAKLSPVTDLSVDGTMLCGVDLARKTVTYPADQFRYSAAVLSGSDFQDQTAAAAIPSEAGRICFALSHVAANGGVQDDAASRYIRVDISNGKALAPLHVYLYDLGTQRGFRLVGIER